jgi:CBS domain-containing protein
MTRDDRKPESKTQGLDAAWLRDALRTLVTRPPVRVPRGTALSDAIEQMRSARTGACLVDNDDGTLAGIFTERDLLNKIPTRNTDLASRAVDEYMHPNPETLTPEHPIAFALNRMAGGKYRHIPLVDDEQKVIGLVAQRDIVVEICQHFGDDVLSIPPTRRAAIADEREGA